MEESVVKMTKEEKRRRAKLMKHAREGMVVMEETVFCPICGASSYPYKHEHWAGAANREPLYCGACNRDMTPAVRAMKQYMKDYVDLMQGKDVERMTDDSEV